MNPTILVVDDMPSALVVARHVLSYDAYNILTASDGPTALTIARQACPDLILLDLMMPGMDGIEVCRRLRAEEPAVASSAIVMLTAYGDDVTRAKAIAAQADDFLTKPVNRWELRARVGSLLRLSAHRRQHHAAQPFRDLATDGYDGLVVLGACRTVVEANVAARHLLGVTPEDYFTATIDTIIDRRYVGQLNSALDVTQQPVGVSAPAYFARRGQDDPGPTWLSAREVRTGLRGESIVQIADVSASYRRSGHLSAVQPSARTGSGGIA